MIKLYKDAQEIIDTLILPQYPEIKAKCLNIVGEIDNNKKIVNSVSASPDDYEYKKAKQKIEIAKWLTHVFEQFDPDKLLEIDPFFAIEHLSGAKHYHEGKSCEFKIDLFDHWLSIRESYSWREVVDDMLQCLLNRQQTILHMDLSYSRIDMSPYVIKMNKNGKESICYDFCAAMDAIEEEYGLNTRDIFGKYYYNENQKYPVTASLGHNVSLCMTQRPCKENPGALTLVVEESYKKVPPGRRLVPYMDHWHHLLETDFISLSRQNVNLLNTQKQQEHPIYAKIREIIALECSFHDGEHIQFIVDW